MNTKNKIQSWFKSIHFVILLTGTIFLSSCMMMTPFHHNHNRHDHHRDYRYSDPVCGHTIDQTPGEYFYDYQGEIYYFHSQSCMDLFILEPQKYHNHHNNYRHSGLFWGISGIAMGAMMIFMVI